jgi:hypothetical protein
LNGDNDTAQDLFHLVISGRSVGNTVPSAQFRAEAFQEFIDDGSVFTKPYGMPTILGHCAFSSQMFYLIIVSLISADTWRQIVRALLALWPAESFDNWRLSWIATSCIRWGGYAISSLQLTSLKNRRDSTSVICDCDNFVLWKETASLIARILEEPLRTASTRWFDNARRRLCYREMTDFMLAFVNTDLNQEELMQIAQISLDAYDDDIVRRIDLSRIIDRVRRAHIAAKKRMNNKPRLL